MYTNILLTVNWLAMLLYHIHKCSSRTCKLTVTKRINVWRFLHAQYTQTNLY